MNKPLLIVGAVFAILGLGLVLMPQTIHDIPLMGLLIHEHPSVGMETDMSEAAEMSGIVHKGIFYLIRGLFYLSLGYRSNN